jgi:hypothetical protein
MALQKDYTLKTINVSNAYHQINKVIVQEDKAFIHISVFENFDSSSNYENILEKRSLEVVGQHLIDYFLTVHESDNVLKRAETYLINNVNEYSGALQL